MNPLALLGVLSSAVFSGTSLLYTTLGEIVGERSGIVNIAMEGIMIVGAFFAAAVSWNDSPLMLVKATTS